MIAILSPAKNMKTGAAADTVPAFLQQAHYLGDRRGGKRLIGVLFVEDSSRFRFNENE